MLVEDIGSLLKLQGLCKSPITGCSMAADQVYWHCHSDFLELKEDDHLQRILKLLHFVCTLL